MTYLQPTGTPPLQGQDLNDFVQEWMAGIIGPANLDPTLIRPYSQSEPPVVPNSGTAWMAFTQHAEDSDSFPYINPRADNSGVDIQRQETLAVLCSFYDTGVGGQAAALASLLRDGTAIPDNLEVLSLNNFGLVSCEAEVAVPSLLNELWLYRIDLPFKLRRQISRTYGVPNIASASGTLYTDTGLPPVPVQPRTN